LRNCREILHNLNFRFDKKQLLSIQKLIQILFLQLISNVRSVVYEEITSAPNKSF